MHFALRPLIPALFALLLTVPATSSAQSRIPALDRDDRAGEVGRAARQKAIERFDSADVDKDGKLSRTEVGERPYLNDNFGQLDKNGDGFLDWEEFIGHDRWKKE